MGLKIGIIWGVNNEAREDALRRKARGGKSGQQKDRVTPERGPSGTQVPGRDRATETIKGETFHR